MLIRQELLPLESVRQPNFSHLILRKLHLKSIVTDWAWWFTSVILALVRLRQEDMEFKVSLGYLVKPWLSNKTNKKNPKT
jgi:hypothetical protein